jgi:hypothetical protein
MCFQTLHVLVALSGKIRRHTQSAYFSSTTATCVQSCTRPTRTTDHHNTQAPYCYYSILLCSQLLCVCVCSLRHDAIGHPLEVVVLPGAVRVIALTNEG